MENQTAGELYQALAEAAENNDGRFWAQQFMAIVQQPNSPEINESLMEAWFCNAIMAGYDAGVRSVSKPD